MASDWRDNAHCRGADPNIFVPNEGRGANGGRNTYTVARSFCAECLVRAECLQFALEMNMEFGMFGGTTPRERRKMRRKIDVAQSR